LLKLQEGKLKIAQVTGDEIFPEGSKPKNLIITRTKSQKKYREKNRK